MVSQQIIDHLQQEQEESKVIVKTDNESTFFEESGSDYKEGS